jgi:HEPN domain-containing protein
MNKIRREVSELYMRLETGKIFNAYHDYMYEMKYLVYYLKDDDIDEAKEILKKCKAIIKAQSILRNSGLKG